MRSSLKRIKMNLETGKEGGEEGVGVVVVVVGGGGGAI